MSKMFCSVPRRTFRSDRLRWTVLFIAHGELLYSLWLQRCRAIHDNDGNDAQALLNKHAVVSLARHRINRALETLSYTRLWKDESLTQLCNKLRKKMQDVPP
jgi:hypothetical protein